MKRIKRLQISSLLVFFILFGIGSLAFFKTLRADCISVLSSEKNVKEIVASFKGDFEKNVPSNDRMNALLYNLTGICNSDQVIIGIDNWLFYSSKNDGDPIADYEGTNDYTDKQLEKAKNNMFNTQKRHEKKGISFCLMVSPNKENVYSKYMPRKYVQTDVTRTDRLVDYLKQNGINAVNPKDDLLKLSDDFKTYYKYDTHWNELGAYIGTKCVLNTFKLNIPDADEAIIEEDIKCNEDLVSIAGLDGVFKPDYGLTTKRILHNIDEQQLDAQEIYHNHNDKAEYNKSILLIGDSFRKAMAPNLGYIFKDVYVVHRDKYKKEMLDNISPDYLIMEFVERYSNETEDFRIM